MTDLDEQAIEAAETEAILAALSGARYWTVGVEQGRPWLDGAPFESDEGVSPRVRVIELYPLLHVLTVARRKRRMARGPADPRQRRVEHELEETCNCEFPNECLFEAGFKAAGDHLQYRLIACEPRGECPVCGGETDHVDSCLVGILERRLAARGSSTPEQPAGQSTALVEVKAEEDLGLVRVQLSLDAPSYLLPASQARNLGELLIEAVERIKHDD